MEISQLAQRSGKLIDNNPKLSIGWTRQTGNTAAHALANWAFSEPNRIWVNDTPSCILDIIQNEISLCNSNS
jgi:hypothetical protein